jgi:malate dehydrogenase
VSGAVKVLEGVAMELEDCAFPTLCGVEIGDGANHIFDGDTDDYRGALLPSRAGD